MKKIGFIDYFLDEWHANNYPQWIRESCKAAGRDWDVAYAWADSDKPGGIDTAAWCNKFDVEMVSTIEEVVDRCDYLIVLSPDNPEQHERLAATPLASGKPVYIDKTFSPDLASGKRIFEMAHKAGTPMFSTSALRFAKEFEAYPNKKVNRDTLEYLAAFGPGRFENYAVHQLEIIVAMMGTGARRIKSISTQHGKLLIVDYGDGRLSSMQQMADNPFHASLQLRDGEGVFIQQCSDFFQRLIEAILRFFETREPAVPKEETLEVMALLEAGTLALEAPDVWKSVGEGR